MKKYHFHYKTQTTEILFDDGKLTTLRDFFPNDCIIITDTNIASYYANLLENNTVIVVPAGEECKSLSTYQFVCERLLIEKCSKDSTLVAFGGGTITDLTGFVASTFKRGMKLIQIPTTLIAQVDASIGGKNALNLQFYKNQLGTIYQPHQVIIYPRLLETLPEEEIRNGMAEIIKYALLFDYSMFQKLEEQSYLLKDLIEKAILYKGKLTEKDEFDLKERTSLNFGHTFGHAIESLSQYSLKHGEAIAWGMLFETKNPKLKDRLKKIFTKYQLLKPFSFTKEEILSTLYQDKKQKKDQWLMLELEDIAHFHFEYKTIEQLEELIDECFW